MIYTHIRLSRIIAYLLDELQMRMDGEDFKDAMTETSEMEDAIIIRAGIHEADKRNADRRKAAKHSH
jgi:hypothetical protein